MDEEEVIDPMEVLEQLCDTFGIRRNQRVSTMMDAIDSADAGFDDDDQEDDDQEDELDQDDEEDE